MKDGGRGSEREGREGCRVGSGEYECELFRQKGEWAGVAVKEGGQDGA